MQYHKYSDSLNNIIYSDDFIFKFERACDFCGFQIVLVSNDDGIVKIKPPSDPFIREKLCWALGAAGFRRIESCATYFYIHTNNKESGFLQKDIKAHER